MDKCLEKQINFLFLVLDFDDSMFVRTSTPEEWIAQGEYYAKHQCWKVGGLVGPSGSLCDWRPRQASRFLTGTGEDNGACAVSAETSRHPSMRRVPCPAPSPMQPVTTLHFGHMPACADRKTEGRGLGLTEEHVCLFSVPFVF